MQLSTMSQGIGFCLQDQRTQSYQSPLSTPLHTSTPNKKKQSKKQKLKSVLKPIHTFQGPSAASSFPRPFDAKNSPILGLFHKKDVQNILSLKKSFPNSFDHYRQDAWSVHHLPRPFLHPVQHAGRKVPIECRDAIEKLLQDMVNQGIITPVTEPME